MSEQAGVTEYGYAQHGVAFDLDDDAVAALGETLLDDRAAQDGYVLVSPVRKVMDEPAVFVVDGDRQGWLPVDGPMGVGKQHGPAEGRTILWHADVEPSPDVIPVEGVHEGDGGVMVTVPPRTHQRGGSVRAMHRLGAPVNVAAYRDNGTPLGYLAAIEIDPDEVQVEVLPETALLRVSASPAGE